MAKGHEIDTLAKEIQRLLAELEGYFWDVRVQPSYESGALSRYEESARDDKETWLFHGTKQLYYKICLFLELKNVPVYLNIFVSKFGPFIDDKMSVMTDRGPLYEESEPSMIIHDDFRDFLSGFPEFAHNKKAETNKVRLILENTNAILAKTATIPKSETPIYNTVRWFIEIVYPQTRSLNKARFIKKFKTYRPDILIPETSSAIEYKLVKKGKNTGDYLDQIKTDADSYEGDPEYKFFYAVVYFQDKNDLNKAAFDHAVVEKSFPENWMIIAL